MTKFVDTNVLLSQIDQLEKEDFFLLSSISITELEDIKTNRNKTDQTRFQARNIVRFLDKNPDKYKVIVYAPNIEYAIRSTLDDTPDVKIIKCAKYAKETMGYQDLVFFSNDILARLIAKEYFSLNTSEMDGVEDDSYKTSKIFGSVHPMNGDIYQQLVLDSFSTNQITMVKGCAGTGKSYLSVGYLLWLLEKNKIDRIVIFCNTVATVNSAKLGYYPGSKDEKLLDSQIGNMLRSKLGDSYILEKLMNENSLLLLPLSDIRGFDTSGMRAGVYITEAQNMDISLMKLFLQRIGEDSICIIDGDYTAQVDLEHYAGSNNGMRRMSEVFRGKDFYGEVELQNIYRSRIAAVAQEM